MISAKKPLNEEKRLEILRSYEILDTLPEKEYDDIVKLASQICGVPISLISLVDQDRCWFKAKLGLEDSEAPRKIAYAAHAINDPHAPMVVEDALADERFYDCPLVLSDPPMRFYVGTPLVTSDNFALGTLCVIDTKPRKLSEEQLQTLRTLANQVVAQFELKKKLKEVENLNSQLKTAYKEMETFSYSVSHDLKAPLRSLRGFIDILQEDYGETLPIDVIRYLDKVSKSTQKMNFLINDLLELSKVARSKIEKREVNFSELAHNALEELAVTDKYKIVVEEDLWVKGDPTNLSLVAQNLIENAVKYSAKHPNPNIHIGKKKVDNEEFIEVSDNGAGFDMRYAKDLFRPFCRMHHEREFKGTGIGLAIVKKVIDRHAGKIFFDSKIDEGTTFYFNLPPF